MRLQLLPPPEAVAARTGLDLGAVQRHPFHGDQTLGAQHAQHLHKQIVQRRLVAGAEVRQHLVTDRFQPAQPLAARLELALAGQLARRADAPAVGLQPQANQ